MKSDHLRIGAGCSVGNMAVVLYGSEMKQGASLGPLSLLMKGETLPAFSRGMGVPMSTGSYRFAIPESAIAPIRRATTAFTDRRRRLVKSALFESSSLTSVVPKPLIIAERRRGSLLRVGARTS